VTSKASKHDFKPMSEKTKLTSLSTQLSDSPGTLNKKLSATILNRLFLYKFVFE
jgi:hypothetical protein